MEFHDGLIVRGALAGFLDLTDGRIESVDNLRFELDEVEDAVEIEEAMAEVA